VDIWIFVDQKEAEIAETSFGLVTEAKRLLKELNSAGQVTAVAAGPAVTEVLETLGNYGVDRVLHVNGDGMERYQGEVYAQAMAELLQKEAPTCLLMSQTAQTEDLAQRLAAMLNTALVTRAMDFTITADGTARAVRPVANGYLFEDLVVQARPAPIVLFLSTVLQERVP
jgi:electron transfer flavoprotein alpha subunit